MIKRPEDRPAVVRQTGITSLELAELARVFRSAMTKHPVGRFVQGDTQWMQPTDELLDLIGMPATELQAIARVPSSRTNGPHIHLYGSRTPSGSEFTVIGFAGWMSGDARPKRRVERFLEAVAAAESASR